MSSDEPKPETQTIDAPPVVVDSSADIAKVSVGEVDASHTKRKIWSIVAVVVAIALAGGALWHFKYQKTDAKAAAATTPTPLPSASPASKDTLILQHFTSPTTGETWLKTPISMSSGGYYKDETNVDVTYVQVGQHGSNKIVLTNLSEIGETIQLYEVSPAGKVTAIMHPDGQAVYNASEDKSYEDGFSSKVAIDTATHYDSLTMPLQLPIGKGYMVQKPTFTGLGNYLVPDDGSTTQTTIATYGGNTLVRRDTTYADTKLTSIGYALLTPIHTRIDLNYQPLDLSLKDYQWATGASYVDDTISPITRGCGGATTSVSRSDALTASDVQVVGKSSNGTTIYTLTSQTDPLFSKAYDEFNQFYAGLDKSQNQYIGITKAEFANQHSVVIIQDNFGQWLVYARDQLRPAGGCAKPVVYLYPTKTEPVSVHVSAKVTISDPFYNPATGWNVVASPDGAITSGGRIYNSLLWEGTGTGQYPGITTGTVVPHAQAVATIRTQLAEQGLKANEISDFMTYWTPKLPNQPYVRLTWFDTAEMNTLAPLSISPKPDTLIRVFLDADGLDAPVSLPAQHLSATPRTGFTVVEWGGLANFQLK